MVTKLGELTLHGILWVYYGEIHVSSIKAPHFGLGSITQYFVYELHIAGL